MTAPGANPYPAADTAAAVARALAAARDRPNPIEDAGRTSEKYARLARDFRSRAWKHLAENDLPQASNKAWGLVAETVKAISAQHGGVIHTHRAVLIVAGELGELAAQQGDADLRDWIHNSFGTARNMHSNFYEDELSAPQVAANLRLCEELAERLQARFGAAAGNAPGAGD